MRLVKLFIIKNKNTYNLKIETQGDVEDYIVQRLDNFFTKIIYYLIDKKIYKIESLKFEVSDQIPKKYRKYSMASNALTVKYCRDRSGDLDLNHFWQGHIMMKNDSIEIMNMFYADNGLLDFLSTYKYNITSLIFKVNTCYKNYEDYLSIE